MDIYSLEQILAANLSWNRARIKFLARFLVALFQVQTVNLSKIASVFAGDAKVASNYKRLQRFVRFFLFLRQRWRASR
jgi:phosphate starvation-inducible membrane PsiE